MHIHFVLPANPNEFKHSPIASERLRLRYVEEAAKQCGYTITVGLSINYSADIFFIGKITTDMNKKISYTIQKIKEKNKRILVDYTDDILSSKLDKERKETYEELLKINSVFIVPVEGLSKRLEEKGKKTFVIPDGIDNIPYIEPFNKNNKVINVLWNGHSSNINSLVRIITKELVSYFFNLHIVSNAASFQILKKTKLKTMPKCKLIGHLWSINKLQQVSKNCDLAILPCDKIWASANRLVTNFRLGLPVIAETINSYMPYSDYYCSFAKKDVSDMFRSQEKWYQLVQRAQKKTQEDFSNERLIGLWKVLLSSFK